MNTEFKAILLALLVSAVPSAVYGAVLAKRVGRSLWLGLAAGFFLPWFGLLFFASGQPSGERRTGGAAKYSMVMLFVASLMVMISTFLVWVEGDGVAFGQQAQTSYAPNDVTSTAVVVWLLAVLLFVGGLSVAFGWPMTYPLTLTIVVSVLGGVLLAMAYLYGAPGVLIAEIRSPEGEELAGQVQVVPGSWVAFVALCTAYWALILMPLGLKLKPYPVAPPPVMAPPAPTMPVMPASAPERPLTW